VRSQHNQFEMGGKVVRMHVTTLKGFKVLCLLMTLGPMHVIVPEILNKDFHVILACRLLVLYA
jgi:hypothetical protein